MNQNEKPINLAKKMDYIEPFHVMRVLKKAKEMEKAGHQVIHLEVGEPDFITPEPIITAAKKALDKGLTQYTPAAGILELREAIANFYAVRYGVDISPERILITPGATGALQLVLAVLLNSGDEVLLPDPGYPCNRHYVELYNGKPVAIDTQAENRYQPTLSSIENKWSSNTKALMLASPANPTGSVLSRKELLEISKLVTEKSKNDQVAALIVDEIYHGLTYEEGGEAKIKITTALSLPDTENLFVINSFSKYFGMTGWRLGWVVAPEAYVEALDRLAQNIFLCASTPTQYAAIAAFSNESIEIMEQRRNSFKNRRNFLLPELRNLGFDIPVVPEGAFYLYANCKNLSGDSMKLASDILNDTHVAVTPGLDFGRNHPEEYIRFAYTTDMESLQIAIERLEKYFK